ncbi:hypothetical protein AYI69_g1829 [Smittium culicis]|uniref:Uncharacterized protein n=1 Tax=Smittium culicis TaxID=133412 RepID=A0A1R1YP80_9FUNG|nr:hypothetical protein AYI69_g1829 [Smittium culicis]
MSPKNKPIETNDPEYLKKSTTKSENKYSKLIELIQLYYNSIPSNSLNADIWNTSFCEKILKSKISEDDLNNRRKNVL